MRIKILEDGLLIEPETDFEIQWAEGFIRRGETGRAFLKCGMTPTEVLGIKILAGEKI